MYQTICMQVDTIIVRVLQPEVPITLEIRTGYTRDMNGQ